MDTEIKYFKAFIRVVKSLAVVKDNFGYSNPFDSVEVLREPLIEAKDKSVVKQVLLEKYPQFFQNGRFTRKKPKTKLSFFM